MTEQAAENAAPASIREAVRRADKNGEGCPMCPVSPNDLCDYHEGYDDGAAWQRRSTPPDVGVLECTCAMTEGSQRRCPQHGEDHHRLSPKSSSR